MNIFNLIQQKSEDDTILRNLLEENQRLLKREAERLKHQAERKRTYREKVKNKQLEDRLGKIENEFENCKKELNTNQRLHSSLVRF